MQGVHAGSSRLWQQGAPLYRLDEAHAEHVQQLATDESSSVSVHSCNWAVDMEAIWYEELSPLMLSAAVVLLTGLG